MIYRYIYIFIKKKTPCHDPYNSMNILKRLCTQNNFVILRIVEKPSKLKIKYLRDSLWIVSDINHFRCYRNVGRQVFYGCGPESVQIERECINGHQFTIYGLAELFVDSLPTLEFWVCTRLY